jgi:hypothetical protein
MPGQQVFSKDPSMNRLKGVPNKPGDRSQYTKPFKKFVASANRASVVGESASSGALGQNPSSSSRTNLLAVGDSFSQIKLKQEIELNK